MQCSLPVLYQTSEYNSTICAGIHSRRAKCRRRRPIACASRLSDPLPATSMAPIAGPAAPSAVPRHKPAVPMMTAAIVGSLIRRVSACHALIASCWRNSIVAVVHAVCAVIGANPHIVRCCDKFLTLASLVLAGRLHSATTPHPALRAREYNNSQRHNCCRKNYLDRFHSFVFLSDRFWPFYPSPSKDGCDVQNITQQNRSVPEIENTFQNTMENYFANFPHNGKNLSTLWKTRISGCFLWL